MPARHSNLIAGGIEPEGEMPPDSKSTKNVPERHTKSNSACLPDTTIGIPKSEGNFNVVALGYDIRCPSDIPASASPREFFPFSGGRENFYSFSSLKFSRVISISRFSSSSVGIISLYCGEKTPISFRLPSICNLNQMAYM